jgi:hypothetical protein
MLWHFHGLQGGGKSWGMCIFAEDMQIHPERYEHDGKYSIFANFWIEIGGPISIKRLLNYEYSRAILLIDEAYGLADSHSNNPINNYVSEVIHQSRKRDCEVFFGTQLLGDLYKRIRESAHRRIECINTGTNKGPTLNYIIRDNHDNTINTKRFSTAIVKGAYHLFNSDEKIMPMHMNPELTLSKVIEIFNDCSNANTFKVLMKQENPFMDKDTYGSCYSLLKDGKKNRVKELLKIK